MFIHDRLYIQNLIFHNFSNASLIQNVLSDFSTGAIIVPCHHEAFVAAQAMYSSSKSFVLCSSLVLVLSKHAPFLIWVNEKIITDAADTISLGLPSVLICLDYGLRQIRLRPL